RARNPPEEASRRLGGGNSCSVSGRSADWCDRPLAWSGPGFQATFCLARCRPRQEGHSRAAATAAGAEGVGSVGVGPVCGSGRLVARHWGTGLSCWSAWLTSSPPLCVVLVRFSGALAGCGSVSADGAAGGEKGPLTGPGSRRLGGAGRDAKVAMAIGRARRG